MDHQSSIYLPLRSTPKHLGPLPPLCLLLAVVYQQQQWTTLCLVLVCIFIFNSILNCLTVVIGGSYPSYGSTTYHDEIYLYHSGNDSWTPAGRMSTPSGFHAVNVLPTIENICPIIIS